MHAGISDFTKSFLPWTWWSETSRANSGPGDNYICHCAPVPFLIFFLYYRYIIWYTRKNVLIKLFSCRGLGINKKGCTFHLSGFAPDSTSCIYRSPIVQRHVISKNDVLLNFHYKFVNASWVNQATFVFISFFFKDSVIQLEVDIKKDNILWAIMRWWLILSVQYSMFKIQK